MLAPKLDKRTIDDVLKNAEALAQEYTPEWNGVTDKNDPGRIVIEAFARLMELLIERVNRIPEKNFMAFLDLVGVEPSPGSPAEVPVTFLLSKQALAGGQVPTGTQIATTQTETAAAQIFETRNDFYATPASIVAMINLVPEDDSYSVIPLLKQPPKSEVLTNQKGIEAFSNATSADLKQVDHVLYLMNPKLFSNPEELNLTITFSLIGDNSVFDNPYLQWRKYNKSEKKWVSITANYNRQTGVAEVTFPSFSVIDEIEINGKVESWLACHLMKWPSPNYSFPNISNITGTTSITPKSIGKNDLDGVFSNTLPADFSTPIYPFGEHPKYGDAFYIGSRLAFSPKVASVNIDFTINLYNQNLLKNIFSNVTETTNVVTIISWEYLSSGGIWNPIVTYTHTLTATPTDTSNIPPVTHPDITFTAADVDNKNGIFFGEPSPVVRVSFNPISDMSNIELTKISNIESRWIRAVIKSRDAYGNDVILETHADTPNNKINAVGPTYFPPLIEDINISYSLNSQNESIENINVLNNFEFISYPRTENIPAYPISPFSRLGVSQTTLNTNIFSTDLTLYIGFDKYFNNAYISFFVNLDEIFDSTEPVREGSNPHIVWEYLAKDFKWKPLDVIDGTENLTTSGVVSFLAPIDSVNENLFEQLKQKELTGSEANYWYRARLNKGGYDHAPRIKAVLLNTVMADNKNTTRDKIIIGSASGRKYQKLQLIKTPVLEGGLWVRESERPSQQEQDQLLKEFQEFYREQGLPPELSINDLIEDPHSDTAIAEREVWVHWLRVPNLLSSANNSRHYTLEPTSGELTFGDNVHGLIPLAGKDNILMRDYRTGGGELANVAAKPLAVKELKSSLPFIDKVFNVQNAVGGSNPWSFEQTQTLGPQLIKNKDRAVTTEDYEWMIRARFSQVARVKCLAIKRPGDGGTLVHSPGSVTMIIVPKSESRAPQPPNGLLRKIENYLAAKTFGSIAPDIYAIGPRYQEVSINLKVYVINPAESSLVERRVISALEDFFHPLIGGEKERGWEFGRNVYKSEIYAVLERLQGVDHIKDVIFVDYPGDEIVVENNVLVASGTHNIEIVQ